LLCFRISFILNLQRAPNGIVKRSLHILIKTEN
jgi:hypothetical protein